MTVKQLKEQLEKYPDEMDVFVAERKTEFNYVLVNSVSKELIRMVDDDISEEEIPLIEVVVLDEE